jgi:hypothetical protein
MVELGNTMTMINSLQEQKRRSQILVSKLCLQKYISREHEPKSYKGRDLLGKMVSYLKYLWRQKVNDFAKCTHLICCYNSNVYGR